MNMSGCATPERSRDTGASATVTATCGVLLLLLAAACGGGERRDEGAGGGAADTAAPVQAPPPTQGPGTAGPAAGDEPTDPRLVALGDSIFHGRAAGGICFTCHGPDAKGTPTGPNLTDAQWLNGDGSYQSIVNVVTSGVPTPKQHPAMMPPMGGAPLTPQQVRAVAAYVYSLSRGGS